MVQLNTTVDQIQLTLNMIITDAADIDWQSVQVLMCKEGDFYF